MIEARASAPREILLYGCQCSVEASAQRSQCNEGEEPGYCFGAIATATKNGDYIKFYGFLVILLVTLSFYLSLRSLSLSRRHQEDGDSSQIALNALLKVAELAKPERWPSSVREILGSFLKSD